MAQHVKTEQIKAFESDAKFNDLMSDVIPDSLAGTYIGYQEGEVIRERLNLNLKQGKYDALDYLIIRFPYFFPIASSASMTPKYSPKTNKKLNYHIDPDIPYQPVFFNFIPDTDGSFLILSCFPDHEKSLLYIDEFEELPDLIQRKVLTSIMIGYVENTFISPFIYNTMNQREKENLEMELMGTTIFSPFYHEKHFRSQLNFFEKRFIKKH